MKLKLLFGLLFLLMGIQGFAQTSKLYIVINEASWCKYCKMHGDRIKKTVSEFSQGKDIVVIHNDITNAETQKQTASQLQSIAIYDYMIRHREAAVIYLFDSKTKKVLDRLSIKSADEAVRANIKKSLDKLN